MHHLPILHTIAMAHLCACLGIVYLSICQLNTSACKRSRLVRARYTALLAGAAVSGLQPMLLGSWPNLAALAMSYSVLAAMLLQALRWHGAHHPHRRSDDA